MSLSNAVTLMIALDETGKILADGEPQTPGDLRAILHAANFVSDGAIKAVLAVDSHCPHECVTTVRRICEDEGAEVTQIHEPTISAELIIPPPLDSAVDTRGSRV